MTSKAWRWVVGIVYIIAVATIWIAASFVVQSVVDGGVSPFVITYICNSLFVVYLPIAEAARYLEDWRAKKNSAGSNSKSVDRSESERDILLEESELSDDYEYDASTSNMIVEHEEVEEDQESGEGLDARLDTIISYETEPPFPIEDDDDVVIEGVDSKGRWTRRKVAKVSLLICPFWFLAQLTFNLSLKYTTVTSNTILSSSSSLFTFLVSLAFLGERFTWVKFVSVLLCMAGTVIVSLGDSESGLSAVASNPVLGDIFALVSAGFYAVYITLIRIKLPEDEEKDGRASMAQFLGFLGLFNLVIFLPVAIILHLVNLEPFNTLTWNQLGLVVGKVATAGLTIQVPLAAIVDTITGNAPRLMDYLGAVAVMIGFAGINIPESKDDEEPGAENENGRPEVTEGNVSS
ncbi:Solute carrier family 35 member F5 [Linum grandiflorum]